MRFTPFIPALLAFTSALSVAAPRDIYDSDHNGLIEIEDLQDLNEIRNNTATEHPTEIQGTHLYGANGGCPASGCNGYELTRDLNFDTNGNGRFDEGDQFWNDGKGFEPIGNFNLKFATEFHGQGHALHNLTINRPGEYFTGLFGYLELASIHDLKLTADVKGGGNSGALAGYAWRSLFQKIEAETKVTATASEVQNCQPFCDARDNGGLIGSGEELTINRILLKTTISGEENSGGLAGYLSDSNVDEAGVQSNVSGDQNIGGLVGRMTATSSTDPTISSTVKRSFVASTTSGRTQIGALAGAMNKTDISDTLTSGSVNLDEQIYARAGGIAGSMEDSSLLRVIGTVRLPEKDENPTRFIGALTGESGGMTLTDVTDTHAARDLAKRAEGKGYGSLIPNQNFDLAHIQCASAADACDGLQFSGWNNSKNSQNETLWVFGTQEQAPGLKLPQAMLMDGNADGIIDAPSSAKPNKKSGSSGGALIWLLALAAVVRRRR
ncbi:hypothetical protein [Thalassolituus hydrocarboniclasticus]|uniref:GlyGly-CTERM sorting domain-containing protein n=1 Tax=Thalassolituus hydrocarboniclasticus TaxID=2742796 RepID=A0ABY6AF20_9GAMM|nr:hypothetical protein [Thalassolituus hydrocarboniclasticus]UXD88569.1 hypothetical protein HUF19_14515 [Thalassolituus hydrocarboniclasticus]